MARRKAGKAIKISDGYHTDIGYALDGKIVSQKTFYVSRGQKYITPGETQMTDETNDAAINDFLTIKTEIDRNLARFANLSDDFFGVSPDDLNWSDVSTLEMYASKIRDLTNAAFGEGEYAKE